MNERGISVIKTLILLTIIFLLGYFATKYIILRAHYQTVKEKVSEQARFAGTTSDQEILEAIVKRGKDVNVYLEKEDISIDRIPGEEITIRLAYTDSIVVPLHTFRFNFEVDETFPLPR